MSLGDIIDRIIYNNQTWYLQDFNGVIKCSYPCYIYTNTFSKKNQSIKVNFTSILSKSAIQFSNFKCIVSIKNKFKINKRYLYYLNYSLIENLLFCDENEKKYQKTVDILKYYGFDINIIEKLIKICKLKEEIDFKKIFTNKIKTKIKKILD